MNEMNNTMIIDDKPVREGFARFDMGMCPKTLYVNFYDGLCQRIQVSGFYANCLQFGLVTLMYMNVGKGRYWKILYYAALSGLIGGLIENGTVAYVCTESEETVYRTRMIPFLLNEIFWIVKEYSVPFLNLIKLRAFTNDKKAGKFIDAMIYFLFVIFVLCRFYIGYVRYDYGLLSTNKSKLGHTAAFVVMALADIICTVAILFFVKRHNGKKLTYSNNIDHYIRRSSYMTLIFVDLIGVILAFFNFTTALFKTDFPKSYINPFQAVKSSFILILACDAMVFKYSVSSSSSRSNSNTGNKYNKYQKENFSFNGGNSMQNLSKLSNSRSIVKNYTTNNFSNYSNNNYNSTGSINFKDINSSINTMERPYIASVKTNQPFGFLSNGQLNQ